ncbi:DUF3108 domain-containing protein [Variovorax sp. PCZ-1]|uniref:DUF3108 domain-containing protein n=1 Tax=Variovorax sp. PCZ-1 TaxID=2835533 RepID=UPI001BCDE1E2|nr:DUF3108 domain-containing protein [Variovorax sp. PCZ-1]MBS7806235.1 DUF3108 domain-containing protein [Variovorax sp. PCZ-1]
MNSQVAPRYSASWPWRGLAWALLAAVLAHVMALILATERFSFSFKNTADNTALSTRMIDPVPVSLLPPVPVAAKEPSKAKDKVSSAMPVSQAPKPALADSSAASPNKEVKIEQNQPVAGKESAQSATETVAGDEPNADSYLAQTTAPASGAPAPPGLKLSYPASARLQFDGTVVRKGIANSGSGVLSWKMDGSNYELSLEATAMLILSRTEKSEGTLSPQGLTPQRYSSVRTGRSEQATHFRAEMGKIQFSNNKPDEVLLVGAQDRLSAIIQLAGIIGGDPERYKIVNRIQMQVAGLDNAEIWEFNLQGISDINVPAANMQALKLTRTPRNEFDQRLEIWLSPQLGYLPIRIRQSSAAAPDQDFDDLVLRRLPVPTVPAN